MQDNYHIFIQQNVWNECYGQIDPQNKYVRKWQQQQKEQQLFQTGSDCYHNNARDLSGRKSTIS